MSIIILKSNMTIYQDFFSDNVSVRLSNDIWNPAEIFILGVAT